MTLQQKLTQADDYLDMLKDKAKETDKLAKENLRLRKNFDRALNVIRKDTRKIERLKEENNILCSIANGEKEKADKILELINRIDKAIKWFDNADRRGLNELLDILKGGDKE